MKRLFKVLRWVGIVAVCALVVAQFFGPARTNPVSDASQSVESHLQVTSQVAAGTTGAER